MQNVLVKSKFTTPEYWLENERSFDSFHRLSGFPALTEFPRRAANDRIAYTIGEPATSSLAIVAGAGAGAESQATGFGPTASRTLFAASEQPPAAAIAAPTPTPTTEADTTSSDLVDTINFLLDDILGLDRSNRVYHVTATPGTEQKDDKTFITIKFEFGMGSWAHEVLDPLLVKIDPDLIEDGDSTFELQEKIAELLEPQIADYVTERTEGMTGVERGVAIAAAGALQKILASEILQPLSAHLARDLSNYDLPGLDDITDVLGNALDTLGQTYFRAFVPEIAKTYAKLGLTEILTIATSDSSPEWAQAIRTIGDGVLKPIIDNLVTDYFWDDDIEGPPGIFNDIKFGEVAGKVIAGLLVDFETLDKEILDDILGLDGENQIEEWVGDLLSDKLKGLVESGFTKGLEFLAGKYDVADLQAWFSEFSGSFDIQNLLGNFFLDYAGSELAQLFVEIDSLPEGLLSNFGSWLGSGLMGKALGSLTMDAVAGIFGEVTASAIGTAIFDGLGAILGAGIGAIAGSVVFELIDEIFDGAISDLFESIIDWIRNDSPQAYYQTVFDPQLNEFAWSHYEYSKDGSNELRLAVKSTMEAFEDKINMVIDFVGQPASFDQYYNDIFFVWGKKHYSEDFATFIGSNELLRISQNPSAEYVVKETFGLVLSHMNFHSGNPIIAMAYDQWKAEMAASGAPAITYFETDSLLDLQNLIGLARFANDYRQDPTGFDGLMASNAPIAITILHQYLLADAKGFNDATTLRGSVLGFETIGSAAAGDTIILDGPAWQAIARGGDDTIVAGAASVQIVDGGVGSDTLILAKSRNAYVATERGDGTVVLTNSASGPRSPSPGSKRSSSTAPASPSARPFRIMAALAPTRCAAIPAPIISSAMAATI